MPDILFLKIALWGVIFLSICLVMARSVSDRWLFPDLSRPLQHILIGFSLLVVILRFSFREHTPVVFAFAVIVALSAIGLMKFIVALTKRGESVPAVTINRDEVWLYLLLVLPAMTIVFFPLISSGTVFFQNRGPDLDGHLLSAAFVFDGNSYPRLLRSFEQASGSFEWWNYKNAHWHLPDFRESIAVEVFIRSGRYTHAVLSSLISWTSREPIWFGYFIVTGCSMLLCPLVIFDACRVRGIKPINCLLLAILLTTSHTYVLMAYEGIAGHLVAMPLLLFVTLNYRLLCVKASSTGQRFVLAILLSALLSTFGEGIQILGVFTVLFLLLSFVLRNWLGSWTPGILASVATVLGLLIAISPSVFSDFILWSYYRFMQNFSGGALHANWSIFTIIGSVPYVQIPFSGATKPLILASYGTRLVEAGALIAFGSILVYRKHLSGLDITLAAATLLVFSLPNHSYATWKVAAIFQALITISAFHALPERFSVFRKEWLLYGLVGLSIIGLIHLLWQYDRYAVHVHQEQLETSTNHLHGETFAIVTPSPSHIYLKLGAIGEAYLPSLDWARDWRQDFSIGKAPRLNVALYYDCAAEGDGRCKMIGQYLGESVKPRTLVPTAVPIAQLLDEKGLANQTALDTFVREKYGVERWCDRGPAQHAPNLPCR
ncbi:MAG: hypothetical protein M3Z35_05810 [Nitrospirota bacterium]|nr:hypothetical protein [Nitrospirota bacterium]